MNCLTIFCMPPNPCMIVTDGEITRLFLRSLVGFGRWPSWVLSFFPQSQAWHNSRKNRPINIKMYQAKPTQKHSRAHFIVVLIFVGLHSSFASFTSLLKDETTKELPYFEWSPPWDTNIWSDIVSGISSDILSGILSRQKQLAVEIQQEPLRSGACSWGPRKRRCKADIKSDNPQQLGNQWESEFSIVFMSFQTVSFSWGNMASWFEKKGPPLRKKGCQLSGQSPASPRFFPMFSNSSRFRHAKFPDPSESQIGSGSTQDYDLEDPPRSTTEPRRFAALLDQPSDSHCNWHHPSYPAPASSEWCLGPEMVKPRSWYEKDYSIQNKFYQIVVYITVNKKYIHTYKLVYTHIWCSVDWSPPNPPWGVLVKDSPPPVVWGWFIVLW